MASKNISTGTPGGAKGGAYGKPDSRFVKGNDPKSPRGDINDNIGTPGGRKAAPAGARWDTK